MRRCSREMLAPSQGVNVDRPKDEEEEEKELDFIQDSDPGDEA